MTRTIPYLSVGDLEPALHFAHANGYPPECYQPLLEQLSNQYHVFAMYQRPLWPGSKPEAIKDWHPLTDDLFQFLDERGIEQLIGVGHSLGGVVTLRAALRQPQRFRAIILIDPVLFPLRMILIWSILWTLGLGYRLHPYVPTALNRRKIFESRENTFKGYRRKSRFRYMNDDSLKTYVEGITRPRPTTGFELAYSPEWEARIYVTGMHNDTDIWRGLPGLHIPLLIIRGTETELFWSETDRKVAKRLPAVKVVSIPEATHLVPLERPKEVSQVIQNFLQETMA